MATCSECPGTMVLSSGPGSPLICAFQFHGKPHGGLPEAAVDDGGGTKGDNSPASGHCPNLTCKATMGLTFLSGSASRGLFECPTCGEQFTDWTSAHVASAKKSGEDVARHAARVEAAAHDERRRGVIEMRAEQRRSR